MKILYLSCHSVLEYLEVSLFSELGHYVFSPGAYVEKTNPGDNTLRPDLNFDFNPDDIAEWHKLGRPGIDNKELLTKEFVDRFDCVMVMHIPKWIGINWPVIKHKPVIWRTIGQSAPHNERELAAFRKEGMKIVRYSPQERVLPTYIGEDALIRFYQDEDAFLPWNGQHKEIVTIAQSMAQRGAPCNYQWFKDVTEPFPRKIYGAGSEVDSFGQGKISYPKLKQVYADSRVYFACNTWPASYCLNTIEAWMNLPTIFIGPQRGHPFGWFPGLPLYEMDQLVDNGVTGFCSDSKEELQSYIKELLQNDALASRIREAGRKKAIEIFGKEKIKSEWNNFFNGISA